MAKAKGKAKSKSKAKADSSAKSLVIVESPAKSKTINKMLGSGYKVTASMGHVIDLPVKTMGIDIKNKFKPEYQVVRGKKKIVAALKKDAKNAEKIYLAADPDREGEAISWHLGNLLGEGKEVYRVSFDEITKDAVKNAFKTPRQIDMDLVNAQQARRVLDRLVGYSLSPLLWKKVGKGLSAGRVQTVALKIIVDREMEIKAFRPVEYWSVEAEFANESKEKFLAKLEKINGEKFEIAAAKEAGDIVEEIKSEKQYIISDVRETKKQKRPTPPFTTSKLQQAAFNKLRFSAQKTMKIAQQLYEGIDIGADESVGLITYMRTDSVRVSDVARIEAKKYILDIFGNDFYPEKPNFYKAKKNAQEAHETIRPTSVYRTPPKMQEHLTEDQFKLYELIWAKFVASQMTPALILAISIDIEGGRFLFRTSCQRILFNGYLSAYREEEQNPEKEKKCPKLEKGQKADLIKVDPEQHFTKPPPRFSDASLVKALEEDGVGRPSTYAPIIATLVYRYYVSREGGYFVPSDLGMIIIDLLIKHFPKVLDEKFTALMEEELDQIEEGKLDWVKVMQDFYDPFIATLKNAQVSMRSVKKEVIKTDEVCEKCGSVMVIRWGRAGRFMGCSGFPNCRNAKPIPLGPCPQPGCDGKIVQRQSKQRKTRFYGCSNYPKCTWVSRQMPKKD